MLVAIILVVAAIAFYAFIGTAPEDATKLMVALLWAFIALCTFGALLYEVIW